MRDVNEQQWHRWEVLVERLEQLPTEARDRALQEMRDQGKEDQDVISLVALHFAQPPELDGCRTGQQIGSFTLGDQLGSGGMGVVYHAWQITLDREVALKLIHPALLGAGQAYVVEKFEQEIRILAKFEHEGIARIYEGGIHTDQDTQETLPFFATQLVRGGVPITDYARAHALTVSERLELFLRVCEAIEAAHQQLVIHRDLKPTNILVDRAGRPFVIDFGLAQVCDPSRRYRGREYVSGTPAYMSPEQVSNAFGPVDQLSDLYTLGVILYELLAGQRPYKISPHDAWETLRQEIIAGTPPKLSQCNDECHGDLETIVAKTLMKRPADRYASVSTLHRELRRYLDRVEKIAIERAIRGDRLWRQVFLTRMLRFVTRFKLRKRFVPVASIAALVGLLILWLFPYRDVLRGHHYFSRGDHVQAIGAYQNALARMKGPLDWWQRGLISNRLRLAQGYQALQQANWSQAKDVFHQLQQQSESQWKSQGYAGLAAVALYQDNAKAAKKLVQRARMYDPGHIFTYLVNGHIFFYEGNFEASLKSYRHITEQTTATPWQQKDARNALLLAQGYQALEQEKWSQAEDVFRKLTQQAETLWKSQGYSGLAAVALPKGNTQQIQEWVNRAQAYDPNNISSYIVLGRFLFQAFLHTSDEEKIREAQQVYHQAVDHAQTHGTFWQRADAFNQLGRFYAARGFYGTAIQYYDMALSYYKKTSNISQKMANVYSNKASLLIEMGEMAAFRATEPDEYDKALSQFHRSQELLSQALRQWPNNLFIKTLHDGVRQWQQSAFEKQQVQQWSLETHDCDQERTLDETWISSPLTLALYTFDRGQHHGSFGYRAGEGDFLLLHTIQQLQASGRVIMLPQAMGQDCLIANLLMHGRIAYSQLGQRYQETLHIDLIDPENPHAHFEAQRSWTPNALDGIAEVLTDDLLQKIRHFYPLRGKIIDTNSNRVTLNIGANVGVTRGLTMHVVDIADFEADLEITSVQAQQSEARVISSSHPLEVGWRVQERPYPITSP